MGAFHGRAVRGDDQNTAVGSDRLFHHGFINLHHRHVKIVHSLLHLPEGSVHGRAGEKHGIYAIEVEQILRIVSSQVDV